MIQNELLKIQNVAGGSLKLIHLSSRAQKTVSDRELGKTQKFMGLMHTIISYIKYSVRSIGISTVHKPQYEEYYI